MEHAKDLLYELEVLANKSYLIGNERIRKNKLRIFQIAHGFASFGKTCSKRTFLDYNEKTFTPLYDWILHMSKTTAMELCHIYSHRDELPKLLTMAYDLCLHDMEFEDEDQKVLFVKLCTSRWTDEVFDEIVDETAKWCLKGIVWSPETIAFQTAQKNCAVIKSELMERVFHPDRIPGADWLDRI